MTARIIEIDLSDALNREGFMFHCPITGTPILGDREQAFEQFASPYFLFSINEDGIVQSRKDDLPEPVGPGLKEAIKTLAEAGGQGSGAINTHELHSFMPNVIADMLPESTVIFDLNLPRHRHGGSLLWIAMDFTLPARPVDLDCLEQIAEVAPVE